MDAPAITSEWQLLGASKAMLSCLGSIRAANPELMSAARAILL